MSLLKKVINFAKHWLLARNSKGFGIHSPFLFHLVTEIIHDFTPFYCYNSIEKQRQILLNNHSAIKICDYGSGSKINQAIDRKVSNIAKLSLKPKKQAQLIFRLINHFQANNILEIGTSLGITTSYMASVSSKAKVTTLEGCPETAAIAKNTFANLTIENINIKVGKFENTLQPALENLKTIDFVFFDGNHTKNATINYFKTCLPFINNNTVFIFDDIHMNTEMEAAWSYIKQHDTIKVTLDLFHLGIVFFKKELSRQHFNIKF